MNRQINGQTNRQNYTNFERNLAMMVIYVPVKFEFDWTNRFRVRVRKQKCGQTDGWTDKRTKNGQTNGRNYTNFESNLAMIVIYLPVKFEFDWTNRFQVRFRKQKMWTGRQTGVGHINLCFQFHIRSERTKGHQSCALQMVFRSKVQC